MPVRDEADLRLLEKLNAPEMMEHLRCNDWRLDLLEARPSAGVQ